MCNCSPASEAQRCWESAAVWLMWCDVCRAVERRQPESCRFNSPEDKTGRWAHSLRWTEKWASERSTASSARLIRHTRTALSAGVNAPIETTFWGGLDPMWPHSFSGVNLNVSCPTLKDHRLNWNNKKPQQQLRQALVHCDDKMSVSDDWTSNNNITSFTDDNLYKL